MAKTKLTTQEVQVALRQLGYYDGEPNGDPMDANFRADLRRFQRDYPQQAGTADGWYGPKTESALLPLVDKLGKASGLPKTYECRRWQLTYYYIADQASYGGSRPIPMKDPKGKLLANVEPRFFASAALEGTGRLRDGRLVNVASPPYLKCDSEVFAPVFNIAKKNGWIPDKPGYAGILCDKAGTKATHQRCFAFKKVTDNGWPAERLGIPLDPYRTIATDTGALKRHDPQFKGKGGVVPPGTRVFVAEFVGVECPTFHADGKVEWFVHDGWFTANDTGGGIYGAHFDIFVGTTALNQMTKKAGFSIPHRAHIWFEGIEKKLPMDYSYGL